MLFQSPISQRGLRPQPSIHPLLLCPSQDFDLLLVRLADENDNHPLFTEGTYQAEVMENSPAGRCWAHPGTLTVQADTTGTMRAEDALCAWGQSWT